MMMPESGSEESPERILTLEKVVEKILAYAENARIVRSLYDGKGLYVLEMEIEGKEPGETIQYEYMRKGRFPNNMEASETAVHLMYYKDGIPEGGKKIAVYNSETGEWKEEK